MIWLFLGLFLWMAGHFFKRLAPAARAGLQDRMGDVSKGVVAAVLFAGLVLMVIGYRNWYSGFAYIPPAWGIHLNNLLMLVAIALFGLGSSKSRLRGALRHPMLSGAIAWAIAHLLVNGDWASVVLFGGIAIWAVTEMVLINTAEPDWERPEPGTAAGDVRLALITVVLFGVIAGIHAWLGYWPFPG